MLPCSVVVLAAILCAAPKVQADWVLTWSDEFDGPALNTSVWNVRNNETHCAPCEPELYMADNVYLENGTLVIATQREYVHGPGGKPFNFTSGWVDTQGIWYQTYGRFEVRAALPAKTAYGVWPAHWLMPNPTTSVPPQVCWPVGGEIDIMEATFVPGIPDFIVGTYHWGVTCGDDKHPLPGAPYPSLGSPAVNFQDFHVFAVVWNETSITWEVDGNVYETQSSPTVSIPKDPFYFILNTAIAWYAPPGESAEYPAYHLIDYVRVYSWSNTSVASS